MDDDNAMSSFLLFSVVAPPHAEITTGRSEEVAEYKETYTFKCAGDALMWPTSECGGTLNLWGRGGGRPIQVETEKGDKKGRTKAKINRGWGRSSGSRMT